MYKYTVGNDISYVLSSKMVNMLKYMIFLAAFAAVSASPNGKNYLLSLSKEELSNISPTILEDAILDTDQLVEKYGYPSENHEVETEDGYLITMHRIPNGKIPTTGNKIPVLVMHGLTSSSADWVVNGPEQALAYILADEGYDVWMGNARGNYYSRKHVSMNPDTDSKFWKFSWNEIGYYDLPAMIAYILENTGHSKLHYIGHSQGTTSFFVMAAERPEINEKILSMQAMGPATYMTHAETPLLKYLGPYADRLETILSVLGINELLPNSNLTTNVGQLFCSEESKYLNVCTSVLFVFGGYSPDQLNVTMLPVYLGHTPAGCATRQPVHYAQVHMSGKFRKYDHGSVLNLIIYGSAEPPNYDLSKITCPVALHYTDNDLFVANQDVDQLYSELGNPLGKFKVPLTTFSHLDFIWGIDANTLVYDKTIRLMRSLE
ncbi:lipase 3-like [Arctopsyche grandis]|uniref:lipase 3-like n=1 Tax=Arctopsyche grandis TaxID=121162 RepID=UPI00406D6648